MGCALADRLGLWRTVDAITFGGEGDPHKADRIVGSRRQLELSLHINAAKVQRWIVVIGRVLGDGCDLKVAGWGGALAAANRSGVNRDKAIVFVIGKHALAGRLYFDARDFAGKLLALDIGDYNLSARQTQKPR